ncbi:MAG: hypothetical protein U9R08_03745 [Nanoarchaeota archaeon]|nr:hypothetical protein [Nanoarchaeota archaeon]
MVNTPIIPIPEKLKISFIIVYFILLLAIFVLWILFVIFQDRWKLSEKRIEQVGYWFNSLLMILLGYIGGILTG